MVAANTYNLGVVEDETGGSLGLTGQPACLTDEPQIQMRNPVSKKKADGF